MTSPWLTAGDELTGPLVANFHLSVPSARFTAYTFRSALPMYTVFAVTAGEEMSLPAALNFHTILPIDGAVEELYTPRCSGPPRNIAVSVSDARTATTM